MRSPAVEGHVQDGVAAAGPAHVNGVERLVTRPCGLLPWSQRGTLPGLYKNLLGVSLRDSALMDEGRFQTLDF